MCIGVHGCHDDLISPQCLKQPASHQTEMADNKEQETACINTKVIALELLLDMQINNHCAIFTGCWRSSYDEVAFASSAGYHQHILLWGPVY